MSTLFSKLVLRNGIMKKSLYSHFGNGAAKYSSLWEPDYLILAKTKTPEYDLVNIQTKGYDFVILENYQALVHKIANLMDIDVVTGWATPNQDLKVVKFLPRSSNVEYEYRLKLYERNLQVVDVKSNILPLFIEAIVTCCPPGVKLSVHNHEPDMEEIRYVPDYELIAKQKELENVGIDPRTKKKL